ncbi:MAG: YkgJ family cysteine cluster protein [Deltaproteobacteria bacterium]|jgi:Fe-S-cluster containining protein|nr:YkgJ family cysteine cluster protein [Deltaproteobacteria bacterium]MBT4639131.1 YkgJ family cysteine cluster protein [Deltaproteobacteria bacterium]MBT6612317.1 YkgJ family cysteine cluster protein [Deltaproteobacteria bacterium]MBT7892845.1 YkgJ family cysteine cluster protein [Deltaproteobacteria bacterium]
MIKKHIFNYGPIAGSKAIEPEFYMPELEGNFDNKMRVSVKKFLRLYKKNISKVSLKKYPHKNRVLAFVHSITDQIAFEACEDLNQKQKKLACKEGCDACCYYSGLNVATLEWEEIVFFIQKRIPEETKKVLFSQVVDFPNHKKLNYTPCPFLNREQGSCAIYSVRPMACRGFGSVTRCELEVDDAAGSDEFKFYWDRICKKLEPKPGHLLIAQEAQRRGEKKTNILRSPGETINLKNIEHENLEKLFAFDLD